LEFFLTNTSLCAALDRRYTREDMNNLRIATTEAGWQTTRRRFLAGAAAVGLSGCRWPAFSMPAESSNRPALPARPEEKPLDFHAIADSFDAYVMDPAHGVNRRDKAGRQFFTSALEGTEDGGLTAFGPMAMGRELRGEGLEELAPSLKGYYSDTYGLFLDGPGATLCEYWYLMNVSALAFALIRRRFSRDEQWLARVLRSAERLKDMAHQIHYDFNDQGYDFEKVVPFTRQDIYRQPDAVGGYSYVMLLAWKLTGKDFCLAEAKTGMDRYLAFAKNPWYEVPSGAMAVMAAAYLESTGYAASSGKALGFVLDSKVGLMASGRWGTCPVDGLMAGFATEQPGQAYSMETMVTFPYLMPALRYRPDLANQIARYALNAAANLRWFYPEFLPKDSQSRPDLPPMVPYERLNREDKGHSPYAEGDFAGHRSVYGGAYVMWLDKMIKPQSNPWLLRWDLTKTNFLEPDLPPAFLYYNPGPKESRIPIEAAGQVRDLKSNQVLRAQGSKVELALLPQDARVVEFAM
jgi:hypothetical protein